MITTQDIRDAQARIRGIAHHTPLTRTHAIGSLVGCNLYLTAENLQRTGSFKVRGADNKLALLSDDEKRRGVIAASAGWSLGHIWPTPAVSSVAKTPGGCLRPRRPAEG